MSLEKNGLSRTVSTVLLVKLGHVGRPAILEREEDDGKHRGVRLDEEVVLEVKGPAERDFSSNCRLARSSLLTRRRQSLGGRGSPRLRAPRWGVGQSPPG